MMRHTGIAAMFLAVCGAGPAVAVGTQAISYTEPHENGSDVALAQGIWDCGTMAGSDAIRVMTAIARTSANQEEVGRTAGCSRTVDLDRLDEPWRVVRHVGTLCEERTREKDEIVLPDGRRRMRSYVICGREAHALLVERHGMRRTVIDVIDPSSYD